MSTQMRGEDTVIYMLKLVLFKDCFVQLLRKFRSWKSRSWKSRLLFTNGAQSSFHWFREEAPNVGDDTGFLQPCNPMDWNVAHITICRITFA